MYIKVNENNEVITSYGDQFAPKEIKESDEFIYVETVETPSVPEGKYTITKYNPEDGTVYYEFYNLPLTPEQEEIQNLKMAMAELAAMILGGTE